MCNEMLDLGCISTTDPTINRAGTCTELLRIEDME
jgi:hypothetical protein